ncbi:basic salivary proline-rich protein 3-like [Dipodomys merriami]|uniref:basic salivary proline-rich protein 3-like n=1 Tax=Dipodomys merriami TaxID=94247 RepID=UPI003855C721
MEERGCAGHAYLPTGRREQRRAPTPPGTSSAIGSRRGRLSGCGDPHARRGLRAGPRGAGLQADPERAPDAAAGTAAVGAGRPGRPGGGGRGANCPPTGARADAARARRGAVPGRGRAEGSRLWRSRRSPRSAAGAGRRRPLRRSLTKSSGPSPPGRGPAPRASPTGRGGGRAGTPGGARRGRGTSCPGPRPGPLPEGLKATRREEFLRPHRLPAQPPSSHSPGAAVRSARPATPRSSAGSKPHGLPKLPV